MTTPNTTPADSPSPLRVTVWHEFRHEKQTFRGVPRNDNEGKNPAAGRG